MSGLVDLLHQNTFVIETPEDAPADDINAALDAHGFVRICGLVSRDDVLAAREKLKAGFSAADDHPGLNDKPGSVMRNYQKISVGGASRNWSYRPRFVRVIYNPLWEDDVYGMHGVFRRIAQLRNVLQDKPLDYAIDKVEDNLWTAARIHHYPRGGGFLVGHVDNVNPKVVGDMGHKQYHQLLCLMTKRGEDFEEGGGFIEIDGERLIFEDHCELGDIMIYNGLIHHGVAEVDPHELPDVTGLSGRFAAFASLYKDMSGEKEVYAGYEKMDRIP